MWTVEPALVVLSESKLKCMSCGYKEARQTGYGANRLWHFLKVFNLHPYFSNFIYNQILGLHRVFKIYKQDFFTLSVRPPKSFHLTHQEAGARKEQSPNSQSPCSITKLVTFASETALAASGPSPGTHLSEQKETCSSLPKLH